MLKQERIKVAGYEASMKDKCPPLPPPLMGRTTPIPLERTSPTVGNSGCVINTNSATPTTSSSSEDKECLRVG